VCHIRLRQAHRQHRHAGRLAMRRPGCRRPRRDGHVGSRQAWVSGFTIVWSDDPSAQTVSRPSTGSPFIVPCSIINTIIDRTGHTGLSHNNLRRRP
jgi:hypothetical protein